MTSFINLLASDAWSEADIINRTEALIASEFPANAVAILNRKVTAATIGAYTLTEEEQAEVARYAQVCTDAATEGNAARADMALLQAALNCEAAQARLALPVPDPALQQDADERGAAQAVLNAAPLDVLDLVALRAPVVLLNEVPL